AVPRWPASKGAPCPLRVSKPMKPIFLVFLTAAAVHAQSTLTIGEAIASGISHNLDIAAARYGISVAEAKQITAALRPNPVITTSATHLDLLGTGYTGSNNAGPNEFAIHTDFPLERAHKRELRIEVAAAERTLAQLAFEDAVRKLVLD